MEREHGVRLVATEHMTCDYEQNCHVEPGEGYYLGETAEDGREIVICERCWAQW